MRKKWAYACVYVRYYLAEFFKFKKLVFLKKKIVVSEQNPSVSAHANDNAQAPMNKHVQTW